MEYKIALVLPYYGSLPTYFNFYLRSLEGMNFDVLFFSDLEVKKYPENFKPFKMTFDEFKKLAETKLGVSVRLDSPKRLCDFKPMYGKIFEDHLKGYDYWAFGDCDLVCGNAFNGVLQEAMEGEFDVFSLHECYCSGPFCLMRNDERINVLYSNADNLDEVFGVSGEKCVAFDELHGDWHGQLRAGAVTIEECRKRGDSFTAIVARATGLKVYFGEVIEERALHRGEVVRMSKDGRLTLDGREIPLYHYVQAKIRRYFTPVYQDFERISEYIIDDAGFYVTNNQKRFRAAIGICRKAHAAMRSLRYNGIERVTRIFK